MLDTMLRAMGMDLGALPDLTPLRAQIQSGAGGPAIAQAPPFLRDVLLFPYIEGLAFVHEWRKRHPWSAIGGLYRDPPRSSEQILHPDKRLGAREDPIPVVLPPLDALLPGQRVASEDELGEFALGTVLGLSRGPDEGGGSPAAGAATAIASGRTVRDGSRSPISSSSYPVASPFSIPEGYALYDNLVQVATQGKRGSRRGSSSDNLKKIKPLGEIKGNAVLKQLITLPLPVMHCAQENKLFQETTSP